MQRLEQTMEFSHQGENDMSVKEISQTASISNERDDGITENTYAQTVVKKSLDLIKEKNNWYPHLLSGGTDILESNVGHRYKIEIIECIILNFSDFSLWEELGDREGSETEVDQLVDVLEKLGVKVNVYNNLDASEVRNLIKTASQKDYSCCDSLLWVVMSHGDHGDVIYCADGYVQTAEITKEFTGRNCPSLAGKPKLFFFQACRGSRLDDGAKIKNIDGTDFDEPDAGSKHSFHHLIPDEADFLIAFSCPPGYYAWRNLGHGTWFIQALLRVLREDGGDTEILAIMRRITRIVAFEYSSSTIDPGFDQKKQVPWTVTTLTKEFFFHSTNL